MSMWVSSMFSSFLSLPKNMAVCGLSKIGVNVCAWCPVIDWLYSHLKPSIPEICSGSSRTPTRIKCLLTMNEQCTLSGLKVEHQQC